MPITKSEFGKLLDIKLAESSDVVELSKWAYRVFNENSRGLDHEFKTVLLDLARMGDAPEFEYTHDELKELARSLKS